MEHALADGNHMVVSGECDGFNIGFNSGEAAGQTVMYPHIHLIPRRTGDVEDPVGGVRNTIPGKGNYRK
jgi:diadenosine tetraphosphate (Ap4A) HIT family hydrolase